MFGFQRRRAFSVLPVVIAAVVACDSAAGVGSVASDGSSVDGRAEFNAKSTARCTGTIGPVTVSNVVVPPGGACVLEGTRVRGNVLVQRRATLLADGADIDGSIQAEEASEVATTGDTFVGGNIQVKGNADVDIEETTIDGDVQVEGAGADLDVDDSLIGGNLQLKKAGAGRIEDTTVRGDVQLEENRGEVTAEDNVVHGNMQVFKNVGGVVLLANRIAQALQCKENRPPAEGAGNIAGDYEDECEVL